MITGVQRIQLRLGILHISLLHISVTFTDSKKVLNDANMQMLSSRIGANWRRLGRRLGLHDGELDCLEYDNRCSGLQEVVWRMLSAWRESKADDATLCAVADALIELKLYDVAALLSEDG